MASPVVLRKQKLSARFMKDFLAYYKRIGAEGYSVAKREQWAHNPAIAVLRAVDDGKGVGWVVYNQERSTIEEICLERTAGDTGFGRLLDALIRRENLVAAELLVTDEEKYRSLVKYGFRPTHAFEAEGFSVVKMDMSTCVLREKLDGCTPARAYRKKERVALIKVPETGTDKEIRKGLQELLRRLGGVAKFVKPGQTVVIKPNLVSDHGLRDGKYVGGIVTDIRVVKALAEILLPVAGKVIIAEGSSINRSETSKMFSLYGYDRLIDLDPGKMELVDLNRDEVVEKAIPGGKRMASRKIPLTLEKADVIISVPVLKIHFAAVASLGVKHLQGAVPPLEKYMTHFFGLWQNLVNIHHVIKPKLTIIDGLVGQEDFGPVSGVPKKMDVLIGGTNPVAVDAVAMRVMGLDPASSPPVWMAYMQGLGPIEEERITVVGRRVEEVSKPFKQPVIDLTGGADISVHGESACPGCRGYLHFVLSKLRRPDPLDPGRALIDRPFNKRVAIFLGPECDDAIDAEGTNIFMGICQKHHEGVGAFLPGCPPHAEVITNGIFALFPDIERPQYADKSEEAKLGEMLTEIMNMDKN